MAVREEVFEGLAGDSGSTSQWAENLFEQLQHSMYFLLQKYQIQEMDLRASLDVIGKLYDLLEDSQTSYEKAKEQLNDLEEKWKEEKHMRRNVEKRKAEIENRLDEERFQWQAERQEMQRDKASLETKNKHLNERNNDLITDLTKQKEQFEENQKMRDELMDQYKKQYEIAKTYSLKRRPKKLPSVPSGHASLHSGPAHTRQQPIPSPAHSSNDSGVGGSSRHHSLSPPADEGLVNMPNTSPRSKRTLPSINKVSLKTELRHPQGVEEDSEEESEEMVPQHSYPSPKDYDSFTLQQELLNVSPEILAPAAAELELLKKEQEETMKENKKLQQRLEILRDDKEYFESENAKLSVDLEGALRMVNELQEQLVSLRQERDEILECYLDQPFDVYCVTKKELHEVLKKLHETQLEVHRQNEEKQSLRLQLEKKQKKSGWKRFTDKFKNAFHRNDQRGKRPQMEFHEVLETTSFQLPAEVSFTPREPDQILQYDNFRKSDNGWLVPKEEQSSPSCLPSLYGQVTLKEYHVTEKINCMAVGRIGHSAFTHLSKRKSSLIPLAARTAKGKLAAEVWVASSEGPASFIEIIDVLSKKVLDRFLVKGTKVIGMINIPGIVAAGNNKDKGDENSEQLLTKNDLFHESCYHHVHYSPYVPIKGVASNEEGAELPKESENLINRNTLGDEIRAVSLDVELGTHSSSSSSFQDGILQNSSPFLRHPRHEGGPLEDSSSQDGRPQGPSIDFSDDEIDGNSYQSSTPYKEESPGGSYGSDDSFMWVITDSDVLNIYSVSKRYSKTIKSVKLSATPSCVTYLGDKVCVGLSNSKLLVYHMETIISGYTWDVDNNYTLIDLPVLNPEKLQPVYAVIQVTDKLWVTTGAFISLIDANTLEREGMRFLDSINNIPNLLLSVNDTVIATTINNHHLYVLDSVRAEVIRKVDISPTSLLLDNLITYSVLNVSSLIKDNNNLYIGTSLGKVFALPLSFFNRKNIEEIETSSESSASKIYPPRSPGHKLLKISAVALHSHRESSVQGLVHISLPQGLTDGPLSGSTLNMSSGLSNASSLPSLLVDSPPLNRSNPRSFPLYQSLLVSGGKGHKYYVAEQDMFQESTALRERNEAFQLIVWGFEATPAGGEQNESYSRGTPPFVTSS